MTRTKRLKSVYLVFGDAYLVDQAVGKVLAQIGQDVGEDLTVESMDCEEAEIEGVVEELLSPSLFSLNKVTVLKHFRLTAENKLAREIERCLASGLAPGQFLVIAAEKVDRRLKLAKLVEEEGNLIELGGFDGAGLRAWIGDRFREEGKVVSPGVPEVLLDLKGDDLRGLASEIEKIVTYVGDEGKVTERDLHALVGRSRTEKVFELLSHVIARRAGDALENVTDLLDTGESGTRIVAYIGREVRWLIQVKIFLRAEPGLWDQNMKPNEFTREVLPRIKAWIESNRIGESDTFLRQKPYAVYCRFKEAHRCELAGLLRMLEGLLEVNRLLVSTSVTDKVALETFVAAMGV
jgi:DNA polymerase-3 subunit delta